jgi:hypothetical protein
MSLFSRQLGLVCILNPHAAVSPTATDCTTALHLRAARTQQRSGVGPVRTRIDGMFRSTTPFQRLKDYP